MRTVREKNNTELRRRADVHDVSAGVDAVLMSVWTLACVTARRNYSKSIAALARKVLVYVIMTWRPRVVRRGRNLRPRARAAPRAAIRVPHRHHRRAAPRSTARARRGLRARPVYLVLLII